jgi:predicted O-linked N-acetylglucosamine transferase (SPINDLY family)
MQRACALKADHAPTLNNLGNALVATDRLDEAIDAYRRAIEAPDTPVSSYFNLGHALVRKGDAAAAYLAFSRACELDPTLLSARAPRASLGRVLAEWTHADADAEALLGEPPAHDPAPVDPGALLSLALPAPVQRRYADAHARQLRKSAATAAEVRPVPRRDSNRPLRVAYLSADLRGHAVGYLLAPVLESHDPRRVTCFAYGWSNGPPDATRTRIQRAVGRYRDVTARTDAELRTLMAQDEIDIAVDLMGYTGLARPSLYTRRVAPVQLGWLGYPGTLGEGMLDWLIADAFIIPPEAESCYAERILRLPDTYLPYDPKRIVAAARARADYGLPATALVLASLGPVHKITPRQFALWMELLRELPEAVLWLGHMARDPQARLRAAARAAGIDPGRLVIAATLADNAEHLARYRVADLVLETYPYGAHSTAADALYVGCPIVTRVGDSFASRVSGSIASAAGMPELITHNAEEYRARVLELGRDTAQRRALRERLVARRATCPLFDLGRFVRALEDAFEHSHRMAVAEHG